MQNQDKIKEAFSKVKKDIFSLQTEIFSLTREIKELKRTLEQTDKPTDRQTRVLPTSNYEETPTQTQTNPLQKQTSSSFQQTDNVEKEPFQPPKTPNIQVSTGNEGVPTDRQTNQQTDRHEQKFAQSTKQDLPTNYESQKFALTTKPYVLDKDDKITQITKVSEIINSLDALKKDLRSTFKKLTHQEMQIYSTIYQLSDEGLLVDYPLLASKTSLSESSIRDYILKLTRKGVPIEKSKENNKRVILTIPQDFKKVASLSTIISLREL